MGKLERDAVRRLKDEKNQQKVRGLQAATQSAQQVVRCRRSWRSSGRPSVLGAGIESAGRRVMSGCQAIDASERDRLFEKLERLGDVG